MPLRECSLSGKVIGVPGFLNMFPNVLFQGKCWVYMVSSRARSVSGNVVFVTGVLESMFSFRKVMDVPGFLKNMSSFRQSNR